MSTGSSHRTSFGVGAVRVEPRFEPMMPGTRMTRGASAGSGVPCAARASAVSFACSVFPK